MARFDYDGMGRRELAAKLRQARKQDGSIDCELGHGGCGCSNVRGASGRAACSELVALALAELDSKEGRA
jgi:hypothetical protein